MICRSPGKPVENSSFCSGSPQFNREPFMVLETSGQAFEQRVLKQTSSFSKVLLWPMEKEPIDFVDQECPSVQNHSPNVVSQ